MHRCNLSLFLGASAEAPCRSQASQVSATRSPNICSFSQYRQQLTADNAQKFQFAYDSESGKYGYKAKVEGADTFFPFSGLELHFIEAITSTGTNWTEKINTSSKVKFVVAAYPGGGSPYNLIYSDGTYIDEVQTYIQMDIDIADDYFRLKNTSGKVSSSFWGVYATYPQRKREYYHRTLFLCK